MDTLLIVDDNEGILKQLKWGLKKDYNVVTADDRKSALAMLAKHEPAVVTLDLGLPPDPDGVEEGIRCLGEMLEHDPSLKVIVITGKGEKENALKAISGGAYDFYPKPIDLPELKVILERAFHVARLERENRRLQEASSGSGPFVSLIGQSKLMQSVFSTIDKVATSDVPVLILGESGTGKELAARAIHAKSMRTDGPFIPINCGAIPENLLESELFGHETGAFTGAQTRVQGKVEYADGGTLFLDEIGELPPALQVKLLRFLQEKVIQRVGGRQNIETDVRIIAATNLDIEKAIGDGSMREDLYYRISVVTLNLPPLRDRGEDIALLGNFFLHRAAEEFGKKLRGFSLRTLGLMKLHDWPGNVRELENKVKRSVIMSTGPIVQPEDLGFIDEEGEREEAPACDNAPEAITTLKEAKANLELRLVTAALEHNEGNVAKAAQTLGVSRPTLYDLMRKHGLHADN